MGIVEAELLRACVCQRKSPVMTADWTAHKAQARRRHANKGHPSIASTELSSTIKHDGQPQQRNDSCGHICGTAIPSNLTRRRRKAPIFSCSGVCSGILRCAAETLLTSDMSAPRAKHVPAKQCEEMGLGSCLPRRYSFGGQLPCGRDKAARGVGKGVKDCGRMEDGSGELHSHDLVAHIRRLELQGSAPRKLSETWRCFRDGRREN
ncbi:hypothetical protein IWZ00DRAFT_22812 [Phyllosticta capitalensis]